jgi:hypothetical protein
MAMSPISSLLLTWTVTVRSLRATACNAVPIRAIGPVISRLIHSDTRISRIAPMIRAVTTVVRTEDTLAATRVPLSATCFAISARVSVISV